MKSWPYEQFGDCFRLINVKMERGEAIEDNYVCDCWA